MPSILLDHDRETVRRNVPKPGNKIFAVAVVRLYIAHPSRQRWSYTGLQGAAVLANDLVGNTFWLKLVDISPANRGVIWDQEIYEGFSYNQDRTFFHTFELEDCLAGFSFVDEKEAKTFKKKVDEREKNASKGTRAAAFLGHGQVPVPVQEKHGRFSSLLHRHKSPQPLPGPIQSIIPPQSETPAQKSKTAMLDEVDPSWRNLLGDLLAMGITEEQIEDNADFIKAYILEQQRKDSSGAGVPIIQPETNRSRPPPPPAPAPVRGSSPQNDAPSRRGPPPPPAPRRAKAVSAATPPESPAQTPPPPPPPQQRFKAPPPIADAGKFAHTDAPALPSRPSPAANVPQPPPRPPKTPLEEDEGASKPRFAVPPPFQPSKAPGGAPPPPSSRIPGAGPPPPPRSRQPSSVQPSLPPPLPPKTPHEASADLPSSPPPPPPLPGQKPVPPAPAVAHTVPPPPPPPPGTSLSGPPAPPPPPPDRAAVPRSVPAAAGGRDDLLASIRATGGTGLKKVKDSEKRDRSAAMVPGGEAVSTGAASGAAADGGGGNLANALKDALDKRKQKVSASDNEDDNDDWD